MAKEQFVRELAPGCVVQSRFFIVDPHPASGKAPHRFTLRDRTGDIAGRAWPNRVSWPDLRQGGYADITGQVEDSPYVRGPEVAVDQLDPVREMVPPDDFLPECPQDRKDLWSQFGVLSLSVQQPALRTLLRTLVNDREFRKSYCAAPAARRNHHAYCGGLMEHSLEVARMAEALARALDLDRDLLITAALLHDVGKLDEIDFSTPVFSLTRSGGLFGHVYLGAERIRRTLHRLDLLDQEIADTLCHLLLSHHGKTEWGAAIRPCVMEGLVLHQCDYLSMQRFHIRQAMGKSEPGALFQWSKGLEGYVYTGQQRPDESRAEREPNQESTAPWEFPGLIREEPRPFKTAVPAYSVALPLVGSIAAGVPSEETAFEEDRIAVPRLSRIESGDFLLRVSGDSMVGAGIQDGDLLQVHPQETAEEGQIVVALVDGESTVKCLVCHEDRFVLRAANPEYPDIIPAGELRIQGRVMGVLKNYG